MSEEKAVCGLCGEPMPAGEEMFQFHGYSGPCPKPPLPKAAKQLEDMAEPELRELTSGILDSIKARLPADTGFAVLFWPIGTHGIAQYGSNCQREDMIAALRETADRLEKRQDVTR